MIYSGIRHPAGTGDQLPRCFACESLFVVAGGEAGSGQQTFPRRSVATIFCESRVDFGCDSSAGSILRFVARIESRTEP